MFEPLYVWLESSAFSIWMRESPSMFAFPGILAAHTVGLAFIAGLSAALDLRVLGVARGVPPAAFTRFLPYMWFGLWVNIVSGLAVLLAYPTKALTNPVFYLKLGLIGAGLLMLKPLLRWARGNSSDAPVTTRLIAALSLAAWAAAIAAGRLLAYTCNRLTVDSPC